MFMTTKTITITEDAYDLLKQRKVAERSFSEVIRHLAKQKSNASDYFGAWEDMDDAEASRVLKAIEEMDARSTKNLKRLQK